MTLCENDDILKIVNNNSSIHGDPLEKSDKGQYSQLLRCNWFLILRIFFNYTKLSVFVGETFFGVKI